MSALTLKDLTLATPPKIVPDFVDELVQPDKLAQLRALYMPAIEADAAQFDQLVPAERARTIRKLFELIKPYDPQTYELIKPFRTHLGIIPKEETFTKFISPLVVSWGDVEMLYQDYQSCHLQMPDSPSAKELEIDAGMLNMFKQFCVENRLNTFLLSSRALSCAAVAQIETYFDALCTQDQAALAQAVADAKNVNQLQTFAMCYLTALAATGDHYFWSELAEDGITGRDDLDVKFWLSAALLEHSATPIPGFSAVAGANPLAIFEVKS